MRADVVIVGGGLAGSAAAWALTRRGHEVVLLEAFEPGHRRGSSHGSARVFRRTYPDPLYVRLTGAAAALWRELCDEAGEELLRLTGGLDFGASPVPERMHALLAAHGVPAELLAPDAASERWPGFAFGGHPVLYHPGGGVIDAARAVAAMQRLAAGRGALIKHETPVTAIGPGGAVRTADDTFEASVVVVAAGAWLEPLLGTRVRLPRLEVTQTQYFHFTAVPADWPAFIYHEDTTLMYGLLAGRDGEVPGAIKVGVHGQGTLTTADARDGVVSNVSRDQVRQFVMTHVPGIEPTVTGEMTCLYTSTANEDFILDRQGPFVVCSPCSGHGAKFAPLIGEIVADLADGRPQPEPRFTLPAHL